MTTLETLRAHRAELEAIGRKYGVSNIRVFGSVVRGEETENSDIDLLVDLDADTSLMKLAEFHVEVNRVLKKKIDVVPEESLYYMLRDRIVNEARPL